MGMFGAIVITFIITVLAMFGLFLLSGNKSRSNDNNRLRRENESLQKQVNNYQAQDYYRREVQAYSQGLHDGRQTDTLYRKMLTRVQRGEQATIILGGESLIDERRKGA